MSAVFLGWLVSFASAIAIAEGNPASLYANAGRDKYNSVASEYDFLFGYGTPGGQYEWTQKSGPSVTLVSISPSAAGIHRPGGFLPGTYEFEFSVTDPVSGDVAVDTTKFVVSSNALFLTPTVGPRGIEGNFKVFGHQKFLFAGPSIDGQTGEVLGEESLANPFTDFRFDLRVVHILTGFEITIPGHYAADSVAANTNSSQGNIWRAYFNPVLEGAYYFEASFVKGPGIATSGASGEQTSFDGQSGIIIIDGLDGTESGFHRDGRIHSKSGGSFYEKYAVTKEPFIKNAMGSPENFLAFIDFDNTCDKGGWLYHPSDHHHYIHRYDAHIGSWNHGDPLWGDSKGKGIIGALNYLASKGINGIYLLLLNITSGHNGGDGPTSLPPMPQGDGEDVWPFIGGCDSIQDQVTAYDRFDVSKLDQWNVVFDHMDRLGMSIQAFLSETENSHLFKEDFDGFGNDRKLYYREMISRFSHHLGMNWNIGEENYNSTWQKQVFAEFIKNTDPYRNRVSVHNIHLAPEYLTFYDDLLGDPNIGGITAQVFYADEAYNYLAGYRLKSSPLFKWVNYLDEYGPLPLTTNPSNPLHGPEDPTHEFNRKKFIWPALVAGAGYSFYVGGEHACKDMFCDDFTLFENLYVLGKNASDIFKKMGFTFEELDQMLPVPQTEMQNHLKDYNGTGYLLKTDGEGYFIYSDSYSPLIRLNLSDQSASKKFQVFWYDAIYGGDLEPGVTVSGGDWRGLGVPSFSYDDVAIVVKPL